MIREHARKRKATHEKLFKGLPIEKAVIPLPEAERICPACKEGLGDTEKPVIVKSQVPAALDGKGPATTSAIAWIMNVSEICQWAAP